MLSHEKWMPIDLVSQIDLEGGNNNTIVMRLHYEECSESTNLFGSNIIITVQLHGYLIPCTLSKRVDKGHEHSTAALSIMFLFIAFT